MSGLAEQGKTRGEALDIVVIAASAGGVKALLSLLRRLPSWFPIPIVVAQHLPPSSRYISQLATVLQRVTPLTVKWAADGELPKPGTVYVAPQDRGVHIDFGTGRLRVSEPFVSEPYRPAADPLFLSAAKFFGSRTVAVVLSGLLRDGALGAAAIAAAGGRVLTQTAHEAEFPEMPRAALTLSRSGLACDTPTLATLLVEWVTRPEAVTWSRIGEPGREASQTTQ